MGTAPLFLIQIAKFEPFRSPFAQIALNKVAPAAVIESLAAKPV